MAFVPSLSLRAPSSRSLLPSIRPLQHRASGFAAPAQQRPQQRSFIAPATMQLAVGSDVPAFSLPANGGKTLSAADLGATTILYFYPRDATPGCTTEAQDFRDMYDELTRIGVSVVGVSKDSVESHDKFVADQKLPFPLISDDGTLCEAFGVWKLLKRGDVEKMGIQRSTFIIKDGKVVKEWRGMKSGGHAAEVVEAVKAL